jgi:hypothetical protein
MTRPETNQPRLSQICNVLEQSEDAVNRLKKEAVLKMLQENVELTDFISAVSTTLAEAFASKFDFVPTNEDLRKIIGDIIFMTGIAPIIRGLIEADKEGA